MGRTGFVADAVTFVVGAEASNVINVALQLQWAASDVNEPQYILCWLSSDAAGQTVDTATVGVAIGTDGTILVEHTAESVWSAITEADGDIDFDVEDAGTADIYLNVVLPNGKRFAQVLEFA